MVFHDQQEWPKRYSCSRLRQLRIAPELCVDAFDRGDVVVVGLDVAAADELRRRDGEFSGAAFLMPVMRGVLD